ncbi:hypothetical protein GCM10027027_17440 [Neomicrococcus lactis]|uniref:Uncharacterized protein n=1 Tax=Neomicrococcus lactis TaxID=732241 RepID=A0A7W8YDE2_9MICC|nr:hypothetical protein [Neomicrococcus lactis]
MNKVDVEKALKLLQQDRHKTHPYRLAHKPGKEPAAWRTFKMNPLPGEASTETHPDDWEPQDD